MEGGGGFGSVAQASPKRTQRKSGAVGCVRSLCGHVPPSECEGGAPAKTGLAGRQRFDFDARFADTDGESGDYCGADGRGLSFSPKPRGLWTYALKTAQISFADRGKKY